jgi:tetrahydromethanopterin S-methyltransferase subunit G
MSSSANYPPWFSRHNERLAAAEEHQVGIDQRVDDLETRLERLVGTLRDEIRRDVGSRVDDLERQLESVRGDVRDLERERSYGR